LHELGIVFHVIEKVEEVCKENGLSSVASVTLEVGEVSAIVDSYLSDCWKWAVEKTEALKGAALRIETVPAVTLCDDCGKTYGTLEHGRTCPFCSSESTRLLGGSEILIKEIEAC
jgi:Zn finger protein HypA/HybF (possibly regulating hydrogenase expression)